MSAYPPPENNSPIYNSEYYTSDASSITLAEADARYLKLTGSVASGLQTLNGGLSVANIYNSGNTFSVPSSSGQLALTSQLSSYVTLNGAETLQNKNFVTSSNSSISSRSGNIFVCSASHNLGIGDVVSFPSVGNFTGITADTDYTIESVPTNQQFTLSGISLSGNVGNAYYYLKTRASSNLNAPGGASFFSDASSNFPVIFDTASSTAPTIISCQAASGVQRYVFPSFGGTFCMLGNSQTLSGRKTFAGGVTLTLNGATSASNSSFYLNPGTTALTGSNPYYWSFFGTPPTSGSVSATCSTVYIQGAPSGGSNNFALQVNAGACSFPSGTVSVPSLVFGTSTSSGFYSSSSNVINTSISGSNILQIDSTGLSTTTLRPTSGNTLNISRVTNASGGTAELLITPSTAGWGSGAFSKLTLGDSNHYISSGFGYAMQIVDSDNIWFNTPGQYFFTDNGSTSQIGYGSAHDDPIGQGQYGFAFGSGASGGSFSIFSSVSHTMKIGRGNNGDCIRFYSNTSGTAAAVGSISITTSNTTYNTTSDARLKENIVDVGSCLDLVNQIRVREFNFISEPGKTLTGVIAQEIKEILPQVVTGDENAPPDEYGSIDPLMVDFSKIVPFLIKSIQELKALIQPVIV